MMNTQKRRRSLLQSGIGSLSRTTPACSTLYPQPLRIKEEALLFTAQGQRTQGPGNPQFSVQSSKLYRHGRRGDGTPRTCSFVYLTVFLCNMVAIGTAFLSGHCLRYTDLGRGEELGVVAAAHSVRCCISNVTSIGHVLGRCCCNALGGWMRDIFLLPLQRDWEILVRNRTYEGRRRGSWD